jgi:chromosomal replication initiation ATPase DnaA
MKNKYTVIQAVSSSCDTDYKVIIGSKRTKKASYARDISAFILSCMGNTHEDICRQLNRDRTSVTAMIKRVRSRIREDSNRGRLLSINIRDILDSQLGMGCIDIHEQ